MYLFVVQTIILYGVLQCGCCIIRMYEVSDHVTWPLRTGGDLVMQNETVGRIVAAPRAALVTHHTMHACAPTGCMHCCCRRRCTIGERSLRSYISIYLLPPVVAPLWEFDRKTPSPNPPSPHATRPPRDVVHASGFEKKPSPSSPTCKTQRTHTLLHLVNAMKRRTQTCRRRQTNTRTHVCLHAQLSQLQ